MASSVNYTFGAPSQYPTTTTPSLRGKCGSFVVVCSLNGPSESDLPVSSLWLVPSPWPITFWPLLPPLHSLCYTGWWCPEGLCTCCSLHLEHFCPNSCIVTSLARAFLSTQKPQSSWLTGWPSLHDFSSKQSLMFHVLLYIMYLLFTYSPTTTSSLECKLLSIGTPPPPTTF